MPASSVISQGGARTGRSAGWALELDLRSSMGQSVGEDVGASRGGSLAFGGDGAPVGADLAARAFARLKASGAWPWRRKSTRVPSAAALQSARRALAS